MRKQFLASVAFVAAAAMGTAAFAADPIMAPAAPPPVAPAPAPIYYDWTGPYVGLSAGYGWGKLKPKFQNNGWESNVEGTLLTDPVTRWYPFDACHSLVGGWGGALTYCGGSLSLSGLFGGGQIGYNIQSGDFVFGVEADAFLSGIDGSAHARWTYDYGGANFGSTDTTIKYKVDAFGTLRARVGFAVDQFLPYVTGGLAVGRVKSSVSSFNENNLNDDTFAFGSKTSTEWGWTIGGGAEYAISDSLSVKAEYLYVDLGSHEGRFLYNDGGPFNLKSDIKFHTVKVGLNWRFGQPPAPAPAPVKW